MVSSRLVAAHRKAPCSGGGDELDTALVQLLCTKTAVSFQALPNMLPNQNATTGFFSLLNFLMQRVLEHILRGEGPADLSSSFYAQPLLGYGGGRLADYFEPAFDCACIATQSGEGTRSSAASLVAQALSVVHGVPTEQRSRYILVSRLSRLLLRVRVERLRYSAAHLRRRYDLAIHARRGDKINASGIERIFIPDELHVLQQALRLLNTSVGGVAEPRPTLYSRLRAAGRARVLLTSDDAHFAASLAQRLTAHGVRVELPPAPPPAPAALSAAEVCGASCVPPLLGLILGFQRSARLLLSASSNMGAFFLSSWAAANDDRVPAFLDLDRRVDRAQLLEGRFACHLEWGPRKGMCKGPALVDETQCRIPPLPTKLSPHERRELRRQRREARRSGQLRGRTFCRPKECRRVWLEWRRPVLRGMCCFGAQPLARDGLRPSEAEDVRQLCAWYARAPAPAAGP